MDKKSKEALRRYKKARLAARQRSSSESSSSSSNSDDSSYDSDKDRHRKKKLSRSSSTSEDERRKREHCQKKLEAKRNHLKRKLKEAKLKKKAAVAAAVLSGHHSHRALSPSTQAKLKKLAERKQLRAQSKERREREKHRERERSPKSTKIRIHQDVKRQKSPRMHHQMMSREKIIIQARTRSHTPSAERERLRHEQKMRHEDIARERERRERERDRAERERERDKERAEALARCQERQRERERIAREKLRREEEEKKYGAERERLLPRAERDLGLGSSRGYNSRERSMDSERGRHMSKRDLEVAYEREREYIEAERRGMIDREDLRREREYIAARRRDLSPGAAGSGEHYGGRLRDPRDIYPEEERVYGRPYIDEVRHPREREAGWLPRDMHERELREPRDFRDVEQDLRYAEERERERIMRERTLAGRGDWKTDWSAGNERNERHWEDGAPHTSRSGFVGGPKRGGASGVGGVSNAPHTKVAPVREKRANSEPDWDADEGLVESGRKPEASVRDVAGFSGQRESSWVEHDHRELPREKPPPPTEHTERRWQADWREGEDAGRIVSEPGLPPVHHHRSERGGGRGGFRRGGGLEHGFRGHPPPLMQLPVQPPGAYGTNPRFPNKRNMTYTNPNLIKKQQAALAAAKAAAQASAVAAATTAVAAAKAAAQSAANATTNPGILGQVSGSRQASSFSADNNEKPEAGEILLEHEEGEAVAPTTAETKTEVVNAVEVSNLLSEPKASGELSEISDSDDDILNKAERKSKSELDESASDVVSKTDVPIVADKTEESMGVELERANDDEEMLDFEEISDGELEEEARHKGVGDALGVDWASLIEETKRQAENAAQPTPEQPTTAKQKWQPHRIILDIGISLRMAGESYAKRILADAQQKLQDELVPLPAIKTEIKEELISTADEDSQATTAALDTTDTENTNTSENNEKKFDISKLQAQMESQQQLFNVERLHPLACGQVAQRRQHVERRQLFANACGMNSRALSARQDLKLRRQLCGLPADEHNIPTPRPIVSEKMKAIALAAFKRTLEVK